MRIFELFTFHAGRFLRRIAGGSTGTAAPSTAEERKTELEQQSRENKVTKVAAQAVAESRAGELGERIVRFRASTATIDRHGTRIDPMGLKTENYQNNPVFLWGHDGYSRWEPPKMESVLGKVIKILQNPDVFEIDVEFAPAETNPAAEMALNLVRGGFLNATSIGFIPRRIVIEMEGGDEIPVILEAELLEVSLVPIPSNPDALAIVRSMAQTDMKAHPSVTLEPMLREFERRLETDTEFRGRVASHFQAAPASGGYGDRLPSVPVPEKFTSMDREWSPSEARDRIANWAMVEGSAKRRDVDLKRYLQGFLYVRDGGDSLSDFGLPFCDVVGGELQIVPRGLIDAAARLESMSGIEEAEREGIRQEIDGLFERMRERFGDDSLLPPWAGSSSETPPPATPAADSGEREAAATLQDTVAEWNAERDLRAALGTLNESPNSLNKNTGD